MNLRLVFFNSFNNLRAGWRIAIFLLLQISLSLGIGSFLYVVMDFPGVFVQGIGYAILLFTSFAVIRIIDHRPFRSIGLLFHSRLRVEAMQGFLISFFMITIVFEAEYLLGYIHLTWRGFEHQQIAVTFLGILLFFLWFAFGEELLFRGYCFQTLIEGTNKYVAVIVLSISFGLFHLNNPHITFLAVLNITLAGVWLSVAYLKTRTLWFPTVMHATWNFFQGHVYSFPVSGLDWGQPSFLRLRQTGPSWITGGPFGPEGGILTTLVLIMATMYIVKSSSIQVGEGVWTLSAEGSAQVERTGLDS